MMALYSLRRVYNNKLSRLATLSSTTKTGMDELVFVSLAFATVDATFCKYYKQRHRRVPVV